MTKNRTNMEILECFPDISNKISIFGINKNDYLGIVLYEIRYEVLTRECNEMLVFIHNISKKEVLISVFARFYKTSITDCKDYKRHFAVRNNKIIYDSKWYYEI